jgi:hypothetical protein
MSLWRILRVFANDGCIGRWCIRISFQNRVGPCETAATDALPGKRELNAASRQDSPFAPQPRGSLSLFLTPATMAEPGPSRSRILAALDLTQDDPSPSPLPLLTQILPRPPGGKRKRGAEYAGAVATPLNKRQTYGASRATGNQLPAGLLANTQSPGAHLFHIVFGGGISLSLNMLVIGDALCLDVMVTDATLTPEERSARETQSVITAAFRRTSALDDPIGVELRIGNGYDAESPLTSIDFGGDDQEKRYVHLFYL